MKSHEVLRDTVSAEGHLNSWLITQNTTYRILSFRVEFKRHYLFGWKSIQTWKTWRAHLASSCCSSSLHPKSPGPAMSTKGFFFFFFNWNQQSKSYYICYWDTWTIPLDFSQIWTTSSLSSLFLAFFSIYLSFSLLFFIVISYRHPSSRPSLPTNNTPILIFYNGFSFFSYIETFHNGDIDSNRTSFSIGTTGSFHWFLK